MQRIRSKRLHLKEMGQSLSDYGMVFGLVAVVAIVSLQALGSQINSMLQATGTSQLQSTASLLSTPPPIVPKAKPIAPTTITGNPETASIEETPFVATLPQPAKGQEQLCFNSGLCANIPVVPENTKIDVAGGNGVEFTHQFANVLQQIADQLEQAEADPTLIGAITALANQGHTLGDQQKGLGSTYGDYYDNQAKLSALKGQSNLFKTKLDSVKTLLEKYPNALTEDSRKLIEMESSQILTIVNGYKNNTCGKCGASSSFSNGATLTHQSANIICDQGGENCHQSG